MVWQNVYQMVVYHGGNDQNSLNKPKWKLMLNIGVSKKGVPQNGWFIMENPIEMDDLGVPLF